MCSPGFAGGAVISWELEEERGTLRSRGGGSAGAGAILRARAEQRAAPRLGLPGALVSGDLRQEGDVAQKSPRRRFPLILHDSNRHQRCTFPHIGLPHRRGVGGSWRATSGAPFPLCPAARAGVEWEGTGERADAWNVLLGLSCPRDRLRLVPVPVPVPETLARVSH